VQKMARYASFCLIMGLFKGEVPLPDYGPFVHCGMRRDAVSLSLARQYVWHISPTSPNIVNLAPAWWSCLAGVGLICPGLRDDKIRCLC